MYGVISYCLLYHLFPSKQSRFLADKVSDTHFSLISLESYCKVCKVSFVLYGLLVAGIVNLVIGVRGGLDCELLSLSKTKCPTFFSHFLLRGWDIADKQKMFCLINSFMKFPQKYSGCYFSFKSSKQ